jgi:hypothetical protein
MCARRQRAAPGFAVQPLPELNGDTSRIAYLPDGSNPRAFSVVKIDIPHFYVENGIDRSYERDVFRAIVTARGNAEDVTILVEDRAAA